MSVMMWVVLGVALGLASPFMLLQLQRRRDVARSAVRGGSGTSPPVRPANPFAAVSIRPCADAPCAAVLRIQDQRYLALRAPALPVTGCERHSCGCRYVRHADRRAADDRRDPFARFGGITPSAGRERRSKDTDRRRAR
ncbi:MAG: hypothetical protein QY320_11550 [Gammaproteobacteria bacterium]|nr:MAG: hypothetical protein QY320_11550 [Gammaproteobacteria bacterium]